MIKDLRQLISRIDFSKHRVGIVAYLRDYSDRFHHPREEVAFARLAKRCPDLELVLSRLSQEHRVIAHAGEALGLVEEVYAGKTSRLADIAIRSTFIVGFPGETEAEFEELLDFLDEAELDRVGAFAYSPVEGAKANALPDPVPEEIKAERLKDSRARANVAHELELLSAIANPHLAASSDLVCAAVLLRDASR